MTPLTVATWNINSVRLRLESVLRFLSEAAPDVLCLQEIKTEDGNFPGAAFTQAGYPYQAVKGMKAYNGVAILSRLPLTRTHTLEVCERQDSRHIAAEVAGLELHNFYVPAGGDIPDPEQNEKFAHKLRFLDEVTDWFGRNRSADQPMMLVGDLNIAPLEQDVWSHKKLLDVVSHTPIEVARMAAWQNGLSWIDAVRHFVPADQKLYSWWSYRAKDWDLADKGRRLDHIWVTPPLKDRLHGADILRSWRGIEKASDHVPVLVRLTVPA